ncbi:MAG: DUF721 domain-containing protein [Phycisphaerales bacterium]|nr:DUF721 domain-containing protein [Phycisphaerales bacterium]
MGSTDPRSLHTPRRLDPLDRLRTMRVRPERARDLHEDMATQMKSIRKVSRAESAIAQAWSAAAPDAIADRCTLIGIKAGQVEIAVPDAPTRYQADRWLRSGGLMELSALAKIPVRGVRFRIVSRP